MIRYFKNSALASTSQFSNKANSVYISLEYKQDISFDPNTPSNDIHTQKIYQGLGMVLYRASSVQDLEGQLKTKGDSLKALVTRGPNRDLKAPSFPYLDHTVLFADKVAFLELLVKFWKTLYKNASSDFLWSHLARLIRFYKTRYIYEYAKVTPILETISKYDLESILNAVEPYDIANPFDYLPLEHQWPTFLLDKNKAIKNNAFRENLVHAVHTVFYSAITTLGDRFLKATPYLHEYFPKVFGKVKAYNLSESEMFDKYQEIWEGQAGFLYEMSYNLHEDHTGVKIKNYDVPIIAKVAWDFFKKGGGDFRVTKPETAIEWARNSDHFVYEFFADNKANITPEKVVDLIEKMPHIAVYLQGRDIQESHWQIPFLTEIIARRDDKKFLENLYVE